ncbi:hypothetical protein HDV00_000572 [Rhizophlyctis rosea]|nr:hypothetical protein HDV00_000572 [Rhizophlyctis rosea]
MLHPPTHLSELPDEVLKNIGSCRYPSDVKTFRGTTKFVAHALHGGWMYRLFMPVYRDVRKLLPGPYGDSLVMALVKYEWFARHAGPGVPTLKDVI